MPAPTTHPAPQGPDAGEPWLEALFIAASHNYFGHHDQPPGREPMLERPEVRCLAGRGLQGDRFLDHKPDYKGQVTFIAWETWQALQTHFQTAFHAGAFRRNLLTRNIHLDQLIGQAFELQGIRFEGVEECRPCHWMNAAIAPGAEDVLQGRGGLRARILTDGLLRPGPALLRLH